MKKAKLILGTLLFALSITAVGCSKNVKNTNSIYQDLVLNEINTLNRESSLYQLDSISFIQIDSIATFPRTTIDFEDTNTLSILYLTHPNTINKIRNNYQLWVKEVKDIDTSKLKITGHSSYRDTIIVVKINTWKNGYSVKESCVFLPFKGTEGLDIYLVQTSIGKVNNYFNKIDSDRLISEKEFVSEQREEVLKIISYNPTINDFEKAWADAKLKKK